MKKFNFDLINLFRKQKILPIINSKIIDDDIHKIETLLEKNNTIQCIEITLREENSYNNALILKEKFPFIHFGLGSILSLEMYQKYIHDNFDFYISPGIVPEVINLGIKNYIPGAETISEFNTLNNKGYKLIKFFPSIISGGPAKLKAIQNIYKDLIFIPTGGINQENIKDFLALDNVVCVGMSNFD